LLKDLRAGRKSTTLRFASIYHVSLQSKSVEDKTFGLKNKSKSKKVQSFVAGVEASARAASAARAAAGLSGMSE
jgi:hypothetical protein